MNRAIVRCRCGHQVQAKEVLRTDLYERRSSNGSAEYVCVRYRCRRCRRLGEAFVAEKLWDWSARETDHDELSDDERALFRNAEPISQNEIEAFHDELEKLHLFVEAGAAPPRETAPDDVDAPASAAPDTNTRAFDETPREPRNATPKPPEKPAPNVARPEPPRSDSP